MVLFTGITRRQCYRNSRITSPYEAKSNEEMYQKSEYPNGGNRKQLNGFAAHILPNYQQVTTQSNFQFIVCYISGNKATIFGFGIMD